MKVIMGFNSNCGPWKRRKLKNALTQDQTNNLAIQHYQGHTNDFGAPGLTGTMDLSHVWRDKALWENICR